MVLYPYVGILPRVEMHETDNYIWNSQTDCLGEGSFGKVFRGTDKTTGDRVAIKMYKHYNAEVNRETRMLQSLRHRFIIQLLAIEVEQTTRNSVIVMELCNGGSLMQFLKEPENANGLCDEDFLLVIHHLSEALEYLRSHDVVHRDVKPDNIMRHVLDDGRTIYKLGDFGTARELPEGQNFNSLHGTEPYLHPHLYRECFFQYDGPSRQFGANTELWSIGVTMYHIATGLLPFRAYERRAMLAIFDKVKRNEGIISGVQERDPSQITFRKELPESCRLSAKLKQLVTPIITGLFIYEDYLKQWTFTRYYDEIQKLVSARVIHVFYINQMQMLEVYVKADETFEDFQEFLRKQTGMSNENQVFLYKKRLVVNFSDDFPCEESECVYLFNRVSIVIEPTINTELVRGNLSNFKSKFMSSNDDIRLAYFACKDLGICKQLMEEQSMVHKFFTIFIKDFQDFCKEELKEQQKSRDYLLEEYANTNDQVKILNKIQSLTKINDSTFINDFETVTNILVKETSNQIKKLKPTTTGIDFNCTCYDSYLKTVEKELVDMKILYENLQRVKINQRHYDCEKIKIVHCVNTIVNILTDKMEPQFKNFVRQVKDWYEHVFFSNVHLLSALKRQLHCYRCNLKKFEKDIQAKIDKNLELIIFGQEKACDGQKLITTLNSYKVNNSNINSIVEKNSKIVNKMNSLVQSLPRYNEM